MPADKPTELSRMKLRTWTRQPVPMISKHSAHSTSLPVGFRTWLWRYTCLLLLISMLWHRQVIFESKGDKLSSSAESRIRTQGLRHLFASRLNACWQTDWAIAWSAPSHYLNWWWNIVYWTLRNKCEWNCNHYSYIFNQENALGNVVWKMVVILSRPNVLNY